jgi:hypothetical protein
MKAAWNQIVIVITNHLIFAAGEVIQDMPPKTLSI